MRVIRYMKEQFKYEKKQTKYVQASKHNYVIVNDFMSKMLDCPAVANEPGTFCNANLGKIC